MLHRSIENSVQQDEKASDDQQNLPRAEEMTGEDVSMERIDI